MTAAANDKFLVPEALYAQEVDVARDTLEILTRQPETIQDLRTAELRRRALCAVFAPDDDFWDMYIKAVIVPGPADRGGGEDGPRGLAVVFRPIVARDEWER